MADIGTTLREARMRARIDLTEVEARTKIRAKYLRAMENEEWDLLPGPVYVKSFLRTYGDFLGLDSRLLIDEYKRQYERPSDHEMRPMSSLSRERERDRRGPPIPPWLMIGVVLVGIVVALYLVGSHKGKKSPTTPNVAGTNTGEGANHKPKHHTQHKTPPKPKDVTLKLVPTGQIYVCLVDGHGAKLIPGQIYGVGQTIPTEKRQKLLLTLGNNSVHMKVNGKTIPVAASASSIGYSLTPNGAAPLPSSKQPSCT
jgi:cytoskeleton protein RodZ